MDRTSCRARKLAATGASALGLAAALALAVPTAAGAAHRVDHNCGNFDNSDSVFGSPFDGHGRHRGGQIHAAEHSVDRRLDAGDDSDGDNAGDRDADDQIDNDADHSDGDHSGGNHDGNHRDGDQHGTWNGDGGGGNEGTYNCDNFDHRGKQMFVPPGLFDEGDHH